MKEGQSLHHFTQSLIVCRNFPGLWLLKHWNIRITYRQWRSTFLGEEGNQNTKRKSESYAFSGFVDGISRGWERKSTAERFLLSVRTNPIPENFVAWLLVDMKFCYVGTSRAFTILFNWTVTLISRALSETPSFVSYSSISRTSKILFHWIVTFASRTLLRFSSIQLER